MCPGRGTSITGLGVVATLRGATSKPPTNPGFTPGANVFHPFGVPPLGVQPAVKRRSRLRRSARIAGLAVLADRPGQMPIPMRVLDNAGCKGGKPLPGCRGSAPALPYTNPAGFSSSFFSVSRNCAASAPSTTRWSLESVRRNTLPGTTVLLRMMGWSLMPATARMAACGGVDDGDEVGYAVHAEVGDGEGSAAVFLGHQLACAGFLGEGFDFG